MKHISPFAQMKHFSAFGWQMVKYGEIWYSGTNGEKWSIFTICTNEAYFSIWLRDGPHRIPVGPHRIPVGAPWNPNGAPWDPSRPLQVRAGSHIWSQGDPIGPFRHHGNDYLCDVSKQPPLSGVNGSAIFCNDGVHQQDALPGNPSKTLYRWSISNVATILRQFIFGNLHFPCWNVHDFEFTEWYLQGSCILLTGHIWRITGHAGEWCQVGKWWKMLHLMEMVKYGEEWWKMTSFP